MPKGERQEPALASFKDYTHYQFEEIYEDAYDAYMTLDPAELVYLRGLVKKPSEEKIQKYADRYWQTDTGATIDGIVRTSELQELDIDQQAVNYMFPWLKQALLEAALIDRTKVEAVGMQAPAAAENAIISARLERLAADCAMRGFDVLRGSEAVITNMTSNIAELYNDSANEISWMAMKANIFLYRVSAHTRLISAMQAESKDALDVEPSKLRASNDSLFAATEAYQSYGVKSVIAPGLERNGINEWLVMPDEINNVDGVDDSNLARKFSPLPIAAFYGGTKFISSKAEMVLETAQSNKHRLRHLDGTKLWGNNIPLFVVELDQAGSLRSSCGLGVDIIAKRMGCEAGLESLRSQILAIYSDLVVPVYVTELYDQEVKLPPADYTGVEPPEPYEGLRRIVLARQRVLTVLKDDILRDLASQIDNIPGRQPRQMAEHPVVWHTRKLPRGYRASQQAREEAASHGIELADYGETFVQEHNRGNLPNKDKGHKATFERGTVKNVGRAAAKLATAIEKQQSA